ncbi:alpha/beta fold hydrolase [uncultured Psychrobacter sp.]|uniref:alpha/beta fold hydrolase n=1 Tax=uncultured Psychrobacter sp. TaxID=259303 RepID=UPI0030D89F5B
MPNPRPIETIHDLFATTRRPSEEELGVKADFHGDVYEALAKLDYIYVDELVAENVDNSVIKPHQPISLVDFFEGLAQLATMGVVEVTDIVEAIHREILLRPLGRFNKGNVERWQQGITGRIYGTVRQAMQLIGNNLASGLHLYNTVLKPKKVRLLPKNLRRMVNILNGVMGDHLITHQNPLAVSMVLYDTNNRVPSAVLSGRVIILCHGLCLSHLSWKVSGENNLAKALMYSLPSATVLYLNYNTGRRISSNGRSFAQVLQDLVENNPDITQIDLVGHSMGGLVSRSALFYGKEQGFSWVKRVSNLVTLGSPHHGASLEQIGHFVQDKIAKLPFAGSLAKLGDMRSAGIIDLRYGSIRDADWQALEGRSVLPADFRHPTHLPLHVNTYLVAAVMVETHFEFKTTSLLGDGLVSVESALGEHTEEHTLAVPEGHKAIFYGINHMNLIYSDRVHQQIIAWLLDDRLGDAHEAKYALNPRIYSYPETYEV